MSKIVMLLGTGFWIVMSALALAAGTSANLSWSPPLAYQDGTALKATDIAGYTIEWRASATGPVLGTQPAAASATSATVPVPCGSLVFDVTVTTTASAVYPNATSGPSVAVPYASGVACTPNPPSGLKIS